MQPLTAIQLLDTWEQGYARPPARQALLLLAAASPGTPLEALARLSIGRRDRRLLRLRAWTFGPRIVARADCPACGERLELDFRVEDLVADEAAGLDTNPEPLALQMAGYDLRFRLPNSLDLEAVAASGGNGEGRRRLLARCLLEARGEAGEAPAETLPDEVVEAVAARMAAADPQAEVELALSCPACDHRWQAVFDISAFFWEEVEAWAQRTLREVHALAGAYGWRETDILALSAWRRQAYLEMIGA
ncbi:MAG: phage baseplate protein [Anaerolineae bacterium]|jgi:hypothetical protein